MFFVGVGGALGALSRYLLSVFIKTKIKKIPLSIMVINLIGSFLLGFVLNFISQGNSFYLLIVTGFLGAFTTFSTYAMEAIELWQKRAFKQASLYVGFTLVGCMALFCIGYFLSSMLSL